MLKVTQTLPFDVDGVSQKITLGTFEIASCATFFYLAYIKEYPHCAEFVAIENVEQKD